MRPSPILSGRASFPIPKALLPRWLRPGTPPRPANSHSASEGRYTPESRSTLLLRKSRVLAAGAVGADLTARSSPKMPGGTSSAAALSLRSTSNPMPRDFEWLTVGSAFAFMSTATQLVTSSCSRQRSCTKLGRGALWSSLGAQRQNRHIVPRRYRCHHRKDAVRWNRRSDSVRVSICAAQDKPSAASGLHACSVGALAVHGADVAGGAVWDQSRSAAPCSEHPKTP